MSLLSNSWSLPKSLKQKSSSKTQFKRWLKSVLKLPLRVKKIEKNNSANEKETALENSLTAQDL